MKKLQLGDLAKKLGYSKTLISMVLNGKGDHYGVSKKTQEAVLAAIGKLDYTPNRFARTLRTGGKSNFVGLIVSDISNPFYSTIAKSIETVLFEKGYNLMVCSAEEDVERERQLVEMMIQQQAVDGLIIASADRDGEYYEQNKFRKLPVVFIDRVVPVKGAHHIVTDNFEGAKQIVQHLIKFGCSRIACLAITPLYLSSIEDRLKGYRHAIKELNSKTDTELVRKVHFDRMNTDVTSHLKYFMKEKKLPDAFFCLNNNIAIALLLALKQDRFKKLNKARIACFDDLELFDLLDKRVTAVAQPVADIGRNAARLLVGLISGDEEQPLFTVLPNKLVKR